MTEPDATAPRTLKVRLLLIAQHSPAKAAAGGVWSAFALIASEWLFFVTKPSALSEESFARQFEALLAAPFPLMVLGALWCGLFEWAALRAGPRLLARSLRWIGAAFPAVLLASTLVLLADNFTYSLFGFNTLSIPRTALYGYAAALVLAVPLAGRWWLRWNGVAESAPRPRGVWGAAAIVLVSALLTLAAAFENSRMLATSELHGVKRRPNILLVGSDGVNAANMSVYGYERDTTPFMAEWAKDALVFENAFANSRKTTPSIASFLSGKLPSTTLLFTRSQVFRGIHAYQHFPGLLRELGYTSMSTGVRSYADPFDQNMRNAFDIATDGRHEPLAWVPGWRIGRAYMSDQAAFFLEESLDRLIVRVLHIFEIEKGYNPIVIVKTREDRSDKSKTTRLTKFLKEAPEPFFAHAHLMGTHKSKLRIPKVRQFSKDKVREGVLDVDFYDDEILFFDQQFASLLDTLRQAGRYENTVVVVVSDHGRNYRPWARVPLIMRFPAGAISGRRMHNVQMVDVAPTILDYMGAEIPSWLDGTSLLDGSSNRPRPVFVGVGGPAEPPWFGVAAMMMLWCQDLYSLATDTGALTRLKRVSAAARCPAEEQLSDGEARAIMLTQLRKGGYHVSAIPAQ